MTLAIDLPGFDDPPARAQGCFRAVLEATARPGTVRRCEAGLTAPPGLTPAAAALLLTLADADTVLWLDPAAAAASAWLTFHCGAKLAARKEAADFVVASAVPPLETLAAGTDETPERGATLILQVPALGCGTAYRLGGPGLRTPARLAVSGLPAEFAGWWRANRDRFPCGVDLVLCADAEFAALPRSVTVEHC